MDFLPAGPGSGSILTRTLVARINLPKSIVMNSSLPESFREADHKLGGRRKQGKSAQAKTSAEDRLNAVFTGQPRNTPRPGKEVVPDHPPGIRSGKPFGGSPNILG